MNIQRKMFEKWYCSNYSYFALKSWDDASNSYSNLDVNLAWNAWQAAIATQPTIPEERRSDYSSDYAQGYADGWNSCREATLASIETTE